MGYTLYLDESGDHNLINIDCNYPIFVLAGCIVPDLDHEKYLTPALSRFKRTKFGLNNLILHYKDYTRNTRGFEKMIEKTFREDFYHKWNSIIGDTDFILVSCLIDKRKHREHYKNAMDPYLLSLTVVLEKFVYFLNHRGSKGSIIAESRGNQLDNELQLAYLNVKISGTSYLKPKEISQTIGNNFYIKEKRENIAGLQLVDSVVTPIGRRYLNLRNPYLDYEMIKSKFRKSNCGKYFGYGFVILPK